EKTDSKISGLYAPLTALAPNAGDATAYTFVYTPNPIYTTTPHNYGYFLPSLDLNLLVKPDLKIRADFSKTETEPTNADIIPNLQYGGRVGNLTATANNPQLLPYLSNNVDLGAEWYYAQNDYL